MIGGVAARPIATLTEESERQLAVLRRGLLRSESIALYVVLASDAARFEVLRRLRAWSGAGGVPELHFFPDGKETAPAMERLLASVDSAPPLAGAVIPDASALLEPGSESAIAALNSARDYLRRVIHGPLVLVLPAKRAPDLARAAPDLFDVRSTTIEVDAAPVELSALEAGARLNMTEEPAPRDATGGPRSIAELQKEAARLRALRSSAERPPAGALSDAWMRLGRKFLKAQDPGEARAAAEEARRLAESIQYDFGIANALVLEDDALGTGRRAEESERALGRALELVRKADMATSVARVLMRLAEVVHRAGRPAEAEVMLREAADLSEKQGETRDRTVAMSQIADILQVRGQLDEALRVRTEEQLPVFDRIGDVRSRAVTLGRIADIHQARGQFDEALRILNRRTAPCL